MREIKFRGERTDNGEWVYGHFFEATKEMDAPFTLSMRTYNIVVDAHINYYVDPKTVGQYTGLKDMNGKEIYEGDIVILGGSEKEKGQQEIFWNDLVAGFKMMPLSDDLGDIPMYEFDEQESIEITGNIYENQIY